MLSCADHPVVHVSWNDEVAYCGGRADDCQPTAREHASRGGLDGVGCPCCDDLSGGAGWRTNTWQGRFPVDDTIEDRPAD